MKLRGTIVEETSPNSNSMIIRFKDDENRQHFEVKCSFNPHDHRFRKWDTIDMVIKWESEVFTDPKTGDKSYFTYLTCNKAVEFNSPYIK
ncbi:hypothetical protein EG346_15905 [Chryseobacterium carnipullorum]|uniref:DUF3127 domain-containing protein n=1 Tax=Chryseobacterium carnipullorum TaxID=1124835 RepID=A0A376DSP9_CHRCU|nr:hypothetical protein [Chryseobacterium carnipullorum]AZA49570.1 hypothetical protein EG346_15905 [Chryseobacterium carnipullorum]AZA64468.1 hypothetical protein EG345_06925 [Chryseobacterium carnipullorum]STC94852.1 Uncharacterised protein [Chryseobacterium carnipullorum]